jgi:hypothetical protein
MANQTSALSRPWPAQVGPSAAALVLAFMGVAGTWVVLWSLAFDDIVQAIIAVPVSALAAAAAVWISRRQVVSAFWGILGAVFGILFPGIVLAIATATWLIFGWPTVGD